MRFSDDLLCSRPQRSGRAASEVQRWLSSRGGSPRSPPVRDFVCLSDACCMTQGLLREKRRCLSTEKNCARPTPTYVVRRFLNNAMVDSSTICAFARAELELEAADALRPAWPAAMVAGASPLPPAFL